MKNAITRGTMLVLALVMLVALGAFAASGDIWALSSNGSDVVRVTSSGTLLTNGGVAHKRYATAVGIYATCDEQLIGVTSTAATRNIWLPQTATAIAGQTLLIKDESGAAGTNHIVVWPYDNTKTIDGAASKSISSNYGSLRVYSDGAGNWFIQ